MYLQDAKIASAQRFDLDMLLHRVMHDIVDIDYVACICRLQNMTRMIFKWILCTTEPCHEGNI